MRTTILGLLAISCRGSESEPEKPSPSESAVCDPGPAGPADGEGPAAIVEMEGFGAPPADLGIDTDSVVTDSVEVGGRTVYVVSFTVTTFEDWHGSDWEHHVVLLSPDPGELVSDRAAVLFAELGTLNEIGEGDADPTWGTSWPDWFAGSEGTQEIATTAALVALDSGLPVILTNIVPGPIELDDELHAAVSSNLAADVDPCNDTLCDGTITVDDDKMFCLMTGLFATEDLTLEPYVHLAVAQLRILDAAEAVASAVAQESGHDIDFSWTSVWSLGSSKRGHAQRLAAALDPRIAGFVVSAADLGNFRGQIELERALWTDSRAYAGVEALGWFDNDVSEDWMRATDSYRWAPGVLGDRPSVIAVGTMDHLFPFGAHLNYLTSLPDETTPLLIPNYGHGHGTVDHVGALRALVDEGLNGVTRPRVTAAWDEPSGWITAEVTGTPDSVEVWCTSGLAENAFLKSTDPETCQRTPREPVDDPDLRDVSFTRAALEHTGAETWEGAVPADLSGGWPACFVRAVTASGAPATSPALFGEALCEASGLTR